MTVVVVVAAALDRAIGKNNDVPWHLPGDLRRFKARTKGKVVVMGRRTWESIGSKPLPGRENLVVSTSKTPFIGAVRVSSVREAIAHADGKELCVLGGAGIYKDALPFAARVVLSLVHTTVPDADTFFPELGDGWVIDSVEEHHEDAFVVVDYVLERAKDDGDGDARPPFRWPTP